jgi:hypothetical protein
LLGVGRPARRTACRSAGTASGRHRPERAASHDLTWEEDHAFWTWPIIEVLRITGVRVEELLELAHYSLVQYRLPSTGELVPLLQIAPSKTDAERLQVVSPELADVLSAIITRLTQPDGKIPLTDRYEGHEHVWQPPAPLLFQRRDATETRQISTGTMRNMLNAALARAGLIDAADQPLTFTRTIFAGCSLPTRSWPDFPRTSPRSSSATATSASSSGTRPSIPTR